MRISLNGEQTDTRGAENVDELVASSPAGDHDRDVASRSPRKTKSEPTVRLRTFEIVALPRSRSLKAEAKQARIKHQIVPVVTNVSPRAMNAGTFIGEAGSMNCGRNARKKSATLG